jgi:superfamily II DNA/RNA helicase
MSTKQVEYVLNYSFPLTVEDYVHRIGRTGRGGAYGVSHTFFTDNDKTLAGTADITTYTLLQHTYYYSIHTTATYILLSYTPYYRIL